MIDRIIPFTKKMSHPFAERKDGSRLPPQSLESAQSTKPVWSRSAGQVMLGGYEKEHFRLLFAVGYHRFSIVCTNAKTDNCSRNS